MTVQLSGRLVWGRVWGAFQNVAVRTENQPQGSAQLTPPTAASKRAAREAHGALGLEMTCAPETIAGAGRSCQAYGRTHEAETSETDTYTRVHVVSTDVIAGARRSCQAAREEMNATSRTTGRDRGAKDRACKAWKGDGRRTKGYRGTTGSTKMMHEPPREYPERNDAHTGHKERH